MMRICPFVLAFLFLLCSRSVVGADLPKIKVTSSAFSDEGEIPKRYVCLSDQGHNISPPLSFSNIPKGTKSLVVTLEDPDAKTIFTHWIVYNLPPDQKKMDEKTPKIAKLENGALQGANDYSKVGNPSFGYDGPCSPGAEHRYFFWVYALDTMLSLKSGAHKNELLLAKKDHVIGEGFLIARYGKAR